jgi:ATP-dependent helicase/DNAse subunit B
VALRLIVGPARSGKLGLVVQEFLAAATGGRDPVLVVPNEPERVVLERELTERAGVLLGGLVTTFDGLAERVLARTGGAPPALAAPVRALYLRRLAVRDAPPALGASARTPGFAAALGQLVDECAEAGIDPAQLERELVSIGAPPRPRAVAGLVSAWAREGVGRGSLDRSARVAEAGRRVAGQLAAWGASPLLVYGFEELRPAQCALVEAIAARASATVALPFEPGRDTFAASSSTFERLSAHADEHVELAPRGYVERDSLIALERGLFAARRPDTPVSPDGGVRLVEVAGAAGEARAVAAEAARALREGVAPDDLLIVLPSGDAAHGALAAALSALDVPFALDTRAPLAQTAMGHAIAGLCRYAWLRGGRDELFAWLRSSASGLARPRVDEWDGRVRGQGRRETADVDEFLREQGLRPLAAVDRLRESDDPAAALAEILEEAAAAAFRLDARVEPHTQAALGLDAWRAAREVTGALTGLAEPATPAELVAALESASVRLGDDRPSGRVRVVGLRRARTHRVSMVIVLGLEARRLPRRARPDALLGDGVRRSLAGRGLPLVRPDLTAADRYLLYAALTSARRQVMLVRRAVDDAGRPREASPFWNDVRDALGDGCPPIERQGLRDLTYELADAPSERERLRSLAALAGVDVLAARRIADTVPGWRRRIDRARRAFSRVTRIDDPAILAEFAARRNYGASELETFADCSQRWFVDRMLKPREVDRTVDARLAGTAMHAALKHFFERLPAEVGSDSVVPELLEQAQELLVRAVDLAVDALSLPPGSLAVAELRHGLRRQLASFVRSEAELSHRFQPRYLEKSFDPLDLGGFAVTGRIDRIDVDPTSARGLIHDYKSTNAESAADVRRNRRLQLPLYMLALRDRLGLEPVGGVYRGIKKNATRGLLRAAERDGVEMFAPADYLDEEAFWGLVAEAVETARSAVARIRRGDVRHDPTGGECPAWCDAHPICRVWRP